MFRKTPILLSTALLVLVPSSCSECVQPRIVYIVPACPPKFAVLPDFDAGVPRDAGLDVDAEDSK